MTNRERNLTFRSLICVAASVLALSVVAIAFTIWALRVDAADNAMRDTGNMATVLAEQTARTVQSVDIVLTDLRERLLALGPADADDFRRQAGHKAVYGLLVDRLAQLPQVSAIGLIDNEGQLLAGTQGWPRPSADFSDRDYFAEHKRSRDYGLYVSAPARDQFSGVQSMQFSRRVEGVDGRFLGVVFASIEIGYFEKVYRGLQVLDQQAITLLRDDGTILVHYPQMDELIGRRLPILSPWYALVARGGGQYRANEMPDGGSRFLAAQRVQGYPLVVNVTLPEAAAFAIWQRRAMFMGAGTIVIVLCSVFLLNALSRHFGKLTASEASLAEREAQLAGQATQLAAANMQIDAALNNITQGLCMFDENARIAVVNQRYVDMYGLSPAIVKPGCSLSSLIEHRKEVGLFRGDPEQYCQDIIHTVRQGRTSSQLIETTDGRTIYAVQQPMANGGWVVTHDDITERRRAEEHMSHMARHDALTGLSNRMLLLEKMQEALARLRRKGEVFTVFVFDLDLFKAVNDSLGHPIGDALLKAVAQRLRACSREVDTVARLGGDEFALLQIVEGSQRESAIILANRLLEAISAPYEVEGHQIVIGTSIGIVLAPADGTDPDQLLKNADLALYRAKSEGRNGFCLFASEMDAEARAHHALQTDLRSAIAHEQFELLYQTVHDARTRQPCCAEALVRWRHPQRGLVGPAHFIPVAEEIGMIGPLGEWVLRKACSEAVSWPADIKLAVNLSPAQFRNCNLVDMITGALLESGLPAERLELEITESVLLQKNAANLSVLHQLKSLGISIVLDDFGTGYSSLSYLRMFPFDKIKIDRSFVGEISNRADCAAIVCAVTGLGRGLDILTTAEGVETEEQFDLLRAAGVDQVQGYLLSRPTRAANLNFHPTIGEQAA
ncbi:MAG TPA: EAL domain-containing protein [Xanthobacteraceae bacterium]|nr:EAL domain-containing protein [Xanthobacteraceae bacterium]